MEIGWMAKFLGTYSVYVGEVKEKCLQFSLTLMSRGDERSVSVEDEAARIKTFIEKVEEKGDK